MRTGLALLALALLALAVPAAAPPPGITPGADLFGPAIVFAEAAPKPVPPNTAFTLTVIAWDAEGSPVRAIFALVPGLGEVFIPATDGFYDSPAEQATFRGVAFLTEGMYPIDLYAVDNFANVGSVVRMTLEVRADGVVRPRVTSAVASPSTSVRGERVLLNASVVTVTSSDLVEAEYFLDTVGADGTGVPMAADPPLPASTERGFHALLPTDAIPSGDHVAFLHARVAGGTWGEYALATFTVVAPEVSLSMIAGGAAAAPGDIVPITVSVSNSGASAMAEVQVDVFLPPDLTWVQDNAGSLGGVRWGAYSYFFGTPAANPLVLTLKVALGAEARDATLLRMTATVTYASLAGLAYFPVHASAQLEVRGAELLASIASEVTSAAPGDIIASEVSLEVVGTVAVRDLTLEVTPGPWLSPRGDDAALLGGESLGSGRYHLPSLAPGPHILRVEHGVSDAAPDLSDTLVTYSVRFVSRLGAEVRFTGSSAIRLSRPVLSLDTSVEASSLEIGQRADARVVVENRGSAPAQVTLTLRTGARLAVVGASHSIRRESGDAVVPLGLLAPGSVTIDLTLVSLAGDGRLGVFTAEAEYATASGTALGVVSDAAELLLVPAATPAVTEETPPGVAVAVAVAPAATVAVTALALVGLLGTERGFTGLLFFFLPLYTRLRREAILEHETRGMIRGYVLANPGDHFNAIKDTLGLNNGTLAYHLHVLEKEGIVRSVKDGKFRRFFPAEMKIPLNGELPTKVQRLVLEIVLETPAISQKEIARILGLSQSTISYHLDRLKELGLVRAERRGMQLCYFVLPQGIEILTITG